jgi:hypothetical protein
MAPWANRTQASTGGGSGKHNGTRHAAAAASPLPGTRRRLHLERHVSAVAVHALVHAGVSAAPDDAAAAEGNRAMAGGENVAVCAGYRRWEMCVCF